MLYELGDGSAIGQKIHELANNKQLKSVKKLSYWWSNTWHGSGNKLIKKLIADRDFVVVSISRGSRVAYFFEGKPEHVFLKINAIPRRQKGKTPHKILVRMIYTRLRELQGRIEILKLTQTTHRDPGDASTFPVRHKVYYVPVLTRESLYDLTGTCAGSTPHIIEHARNNMTPIIEREDVTKRVLDDAWDLFATSLVMEE